MTKTVFFHIGSIKTGSTGLQKFCYENHEALRKRDVDYIQFQPPQLHLPRWANADYLLKPDFDANFVADTIAASPASKILISEEGLMGRPQIWQHPVFQDMRRVVILYLRNSVDLVASWASENSLPYNFRQAEHSSGLGVVSVDHGIGHWSMAYRGMLFGLLNAAQSNPNWEMVIRPFPPQAPDESIVKDFLKALGLEDITAHELAQSADEDAVNVGSSRKYCDAANLLSELVYEYEVPHLYEKSMVDTVYGRLRSGDDRKVIETLSKIEMHFIRNRLAAPGTMLVADYGAPESIVEMPKVAQMRNAPYIRIDLAELRQLFLEYVIAKQK
ncbi:hypothetical protein [Sediminimonas qiaohouensis]|uniref:hypothetical protein n=1 Tax=Sediminimonas qiaohouensis TaxID=552061 RepID=UPI0003F772F9|nr:hypothetical protein [Sediminimonas qiaohouensis]